MKAIILAAGRGSRMGTLTENQPKCLTLIKEKPLIEHQIQALSEAGIKDIAIVTGYKHEMLRKYGNYHFHNENWQETNMVFSLLCARKWLDESDCIVSYSDIYYGSQIVKDLKDCPDNIAVAYDPNWLEVWSKRFDNPLDDAETFRINEENYITEIGRKPQSIEEVQGQYMGLLKLKKNIFLKYLENIDLFSNISMTELLNAFISNNINIKGVVNRNNWYEFDTKLDHERYYSFK